MLLNRYEVLESQYKADLRRLSFVTEGERIMQVLEEKKDEDKRYGKYSIPELSEIKKMGINGKTVHVRIAATPKPGNNGNEIVYETAKKKMHIDEPGRNPAADRR